MATVLIVDDEQELARAMAAALHARGHETRIHKSCAGAFAAAREARPGLIILDVMLGDGAGYQVAREIRQDPVLYPVPILVVSALGDEREIQYALDQGADDYLVKPFSTGELENKVAGLERLRESIVTLCPSTRLPSIEAMRREIDHRIFRGEGFALCCVQVRGLENYRERHGESGAEMVLKFMASLLVQQIREIGIQRCYLSHLRDEYFTALIGLEDVEVFTGKLVAAFKERLRTLYTATERAREEMIAAGVSGNGLRSLLLSLHVSVVHTRNRTFSNARHMLQVLAETHHLAAHHGGTVVVVDRKQDYQGPTFELRPPMASCGG